ncbi:MAG: leucyl/phenylalanyl-tRNA--protein transferase [Desulfobulbaceae bacterium]|nr:leucyl/phenylalanyl-tRNA--protein transferase [Desulfobulbaceae bacterium]
MPVFQLSDSIYFPSPELAREDGLLAIGGDLCPERLLLAYQMGIFPWYAQGDPILWWAPTPRLILYPVDFHCSRSLTRELKKGVFQFSMDEAFRKVICACAEVRTDQQQATWIDHEMIEAYCHLHELGFAHSLECWQNNELVGGLYGVSVGGFFFGESMFSRVKNSSKAALAILTKQLAIWDFDCIDCQMRTEHLISLGAKEISGKQFFAMLQQSILRSDHRGRWCLDASSKLLC